MESFLQNPLSVKGIHTILSQVHPDTKISKEAVEFTIELLTPFSKQLQSTKDSDVPEFIKSHIFGKLATSTTYEYNKAISIKFSTPKTVIEEYLLSEILDISGSLARDEHDIIQPRHVQEAINSDDELSKTFKEQSSDKVSPKLITPEFRTFMVNLLRYRCLLKESTVADYFESDEGMSLLRQAFIHKSYEASVDYELLEFEGDRLLNATVADYIRTRFPHIKTPAWNTRIYHKLSSNKFLAKIAVDNGFDKFVLMDEKIMSRTQKYQVKSDDELYVKINGSVIEALYAAINRILTKYTVRGVGYSACYNITASYCDDLPESVFIEDVYDSVTHMKELFDHQGWNNSDMFHVGCSFHRCLVTLKLRPKPTPQGTIGVESGLDRYREEMAKKKQPIKPNDPILTTTDEYITFGYACINGDLKNKKLFAIKTSADGKESRKAVAKIVVESLASLGVVMKESKLKMV